MSADPTVRRPRWGLGDLLLSLPFIAALTFIGVLAGRPFADGDEVLSNGRSIAVVAMASLAGGLALGLWPLIVSRWKGLGVVEDWRLSFQPVDPLLGLGTAIIALGSTAVAVTVVRNLVNLDDLSEAGNTERLEAARGTPWLLLLLFVAVIGAPLAEELFFRGLALRAIEKRAGPIVAVIGSTILFTLPHIDGVDVRSGAVLVASVATAGAVLAIITVVVDRLWPAVFAHMGFNALGAAGALGALGQIL